MQREPVQLPHPPCHGSGNTWQEEFSVYDIAAGFSTLVIMGNDGQPGLLYERNNHTMMIFEAQEISFTVIDL